MECLEILLKILQGFATIASAVFVGWTALLMKKSNEATQLANTKELELQTKIALFEKRMKWLEDFRAWIKNMEDCATLKNGSQMMEEIKIAMDDTEKFHNKKSSEIRGFTLLHNTIPFSNNTLILLLNDAFLFFKDTYDLLKSEPLERSQSVNLSLLCQIKNLFLSMNEYYIERFLEAQIKYKHDMSNENYDMLKKEFDKLGSNPAVIGGSKEVLTPDEVDQLLTIRQEILSIRATVEQAVAKEAKII